MSVSQQLHKTERELSELKRNYEKLLQNYRNVLLDFSMLSKLSDQQQFIIEMYQTHYKTWSK